MKSFRHFFKIEFKRLVNTVTVILAVLFAALSMYFIHDGTNQYKDILDKKENFKKIEQSKVKRHVNYTIYATQGFRVLFVPSPLSIFFYNSGAFSELSATLDVGERANITGSYKGQNMFRERRVMYADFFGLYILFGSLMALVYGFLSFRYREYLKLLGSLGGFRKVYIYISAARFLLLGLYFFVVTALGIGLVLVNGIRFTGSDYLYIAGYLGLWLLAVPVMFSAGALIGAVKSNAVGGTVLMVTWIFLFYISPLVLNQVSGAISAKMKSIYQLEKEKWDALMDFEKRAIEEVGRFKKEMLKTQSEKKLIESFMNREYKEMLTFEKKMEKEMRDNIRMYQWLSLISPGTVLSSTAGEMSGKGFGSLVDFYEYVQELKDKFCQFYKYKKFYSEEEETGVESFIKGEENIYYSIKRLPPNILWGVVELLVLIIGLQLVSYYSHKRVLARVEGEAPVQWDPAEIKQGKDEYGVWQMEEEGFIQRMYNHLSEEDNFLYLCHVERLPGDIRADYFLELAAVLQGISLETSEPLWEKQLHRLKSLEKFKVLVAMTGLAQRAGKDFYLFHDITRDMPIDAAVLLKERMEALSGQGATVMLLLRDQLVSGRGLGKSYGIRKASSWSEQVEGWEKLLEEG